MSITALSPEMFISIFQDPDLSNKDLCIGHQVCTDWNVLLGDKLVWNPRRFNKAGLPMVEDIDTKLNVVFGNLFTRSLDYELFKKCYGEVRNIGLMSKKAYDKLLTENDPFIPSEELQQKICATSWLVIDPSHVHRPYDETLFNELDASTDPRDKPKVSPDGKEMEIPFTLRNRKLVIEHTNPNTKIFGFFLPEALDQCNAAPEKTGFWVMREVVVYRNEAYTVQKTLIEGKEGYKLVPLRVRLVFDALMICKTGTHPDTGALNWTYARTANIVRLYGGNLCPMAIVGTPPTLAPTSASPPTLSTGPTTAAPSPAFLRKVRPLDHWHLVIDPLGIWKGGKPT